MKIFCILVSSLLLSSCVYYSVQRDLGGSSSIPCSQGSSKDNAKCKAEIKAINQEINKQAQ
ncbi:hypothetical protein CXF85_21415 [Colwellia sp. 75C3]|uniref:hypothetical protein n=1 Tax=Colwellia sp. 75C3 TaxID=888425 RepID=UPI000C32D0EC|nr:hypothetical protein [Colwellia sp. 75C3]PKG80680.1 hypothetical protein CXF85_21415 [Colwellia sp. 75C3]